MQKREEKRGEKKEKIKWREGEKISEEEKKRKRREILKEKIGFSTWSIFNSPSSALSLEEEDGHQEVHLKNRYPPKYNQQ